MAAEQVAIRAAATEFRRALDQVAKATWASVTIDDFPRGACGHCAELLARYLRDRLHIDAIYASGRIDHLVNGQTHAWLEYNGLFIDISADQFGLPSVIVERVSNLHERAGNVDRHPIIRDDWWAIYAEPVYCEALGNLN